LFGVSAGWLAVAPAAAAHGIAPTEPPTVASLLLGWTFPPIPTLGLVASAAWWRWAVRRVNAAHPDNPVPRSRSIAFYAGLTAIAFALLSGIERYDTTLFSVHMVQHILLTLVAAPLLVLSAPITLVLRLASSSTRKRWILPILHSRAVRVLAFPVITWIIFAGVMWASHFSPLFDAALEDPLVHDLEHILFLGSGLLFWWPAVGLDPAPWRLSHPARVFHVFMQMPQNTFLAVVILNASTVLYPHYESNVRTWGPTALEDQRMAAAIMWVGGDAVFLVAVMAILAAWMRSEERGAARADRQADADLAVIRQREIRLADRLAGERAERPPGP
jgi:putative copper resistance protein D